MMTSRIEPSEPQDCRRFNSWFPKLTSCLALAALLVGTGCHLFECDADRECYDSEYESDGSGGDDDNRAMSCWSEPNQLTVAGDKLFFVAAAPGSNQTRLWMRTLDEVTVQVADLVDANVEPYRYGKLTATEDGSVYFRGRVASGLYGLWRTDGESSERINTGAIGATWSLGASTFLNDELYFYAKTHLKTGLWRLNANDYLSGVRSTNTPENPTLYAYKDRLIFGHQRALSSGGPKLYELLREGPESLPREIANVIPVDHETLDGVLYFTAEESLWSYNGVDSAVQVADIDRYSRIFKFNDELYYSNQNELTAFSPVTGVRDVFQNESPQRPGIVGVYQDELLFHTSLGVYSTDGISTATRLADRPFDFTRAVIFGDKAYYGSYDNDPTEELHEFDGSNFRIADVGPAGLGCTDFD